MNGYNLPDDYRPALDHWQRHERPPISGTSDDDRKQIRDEIKLHLGIVLDLAMDLQNEFPHSATAKAGRDIHGNLTDLIKDFVDGDLSELVRRAKEAV